jgi:RNA polymerase sigma-70 factor (ECF subfamily)
MGEQPPTLPTGTAGAAGAAGAGGDASDREILDGVRRGDPAAYDRFVERYGPLILAFGLRMCGHRQDAEDVFQETLVKVYTQLRTLDEPAALRTWLWRVVSNQCLMSRRGPRNPARAVGFDDLRQEGDGPAVEFADPQAADPEAAAIRGEDKARLEAALRNLPPDYRVIILLRDFEGLSTAEVARVLDISDANAKVRLHRARAGLRRLFDGDDA